MRKNIGENNLLNMIDIQSIAFVVLSLIVHAAIFIARIIKKKVKPATHLDKKELLLKLALTFYITCVFSITLLPIYNGMGFDGEPTVNLIPFRFIQGLIANMTGALNKGLTLRLFLVNTFGNIVLFVPFGVLYTLINKKNPSIMSCILSASLLSITIEVIQYIESYAQIVMARTSDIDDVILNVTGAILGFFIYKLAQRITQKKTKFE